MEQYIISPKRERRKHISSDWMKSLRNLKGVEIIGEGPVRAQIKASPSGVDSLTKLLGGDFHIEPLITHDRMKK